MTNTDTKTHDHEQCKALFEHLSEYVDSELNDDLCEKIETHMKDCTCCASCLETLKRTIELCRSYQDKPVPSRLSERLKRIAG